MKSTIDQLIINSPYKEPEQYWSYDRETHSFTLKSGRRPAGLFKGVVRKYRPDFIIRLKTGGHLILETKGQETGRDRTKLEFLDEWVTAVNCHGGFGKWQWAVSRNPADVADILEKAVVK